MELIAWKRYVNIMSNKSLCRFCTKYLIILLPRDVSYLQSLRIYHKI